MDIVYIETSIISHATARPSSDAATAVLQDQAKRWMAEQRPLYELVTSQLVIDEASLGDTSAYLRDAQVRLEASGRPIWQGKQRTIRCNKAAKSGVSDMETRSSPPADR